MRYFLSLVLWLLGSLIYTTFAQSGEPTLMLRQPSASEQHIAFAYASDIWVADKDGSHPRRLTVHEGVELYPVLSPDGQWVAFSGNYDGNLDVYVVSVQGGPPPAADLSPRAGFCAGMEWAENLVLFLPRDFFQPLCPFV